LVSGITTKIIKETQKNKIMMNQVSHSNTYFRKILSRALFVWCIVVFSFCVTQEVFAADATLFLSPVTVTSITGKIFTVSVMVDSGGDMINAIEGKLEYDPKEIIVDSVDKSTSILSSWTIDPTPTDVGELTFAGSLATGTVMSRGIVLKFSAHALRSGELHIRFASGAAIHAADGTGGNIVSQLSGGVYVALPEQHDPEISTSPPAHVSEVASDTPHGEVLGAATGTLITSTTNPDQNAWYNIGTSTFSWNVLGVEQDQLTSFDKNTNGVGRISNLASAHEKNVTDIKDGIWFFHLTKQFADGNSDTQSYRIQVDATPPTNFQISEKQRHDATDPDIVVSVSATDTLSGVDHYDFVVDQGTPSSWKDDGSHEYKLKSMSVGTHDLVVNVFDRAGNHSVAKLSFSVENLPAPVLVVMNKQPTEGDKLQLSLQTVPNAVVDIQIARGDTSPSTEQFTVDAAGQGIFTSTSELTPGVYTVTATAHTTNGALSKQSTGVQIQIETSFWGIIKRHPMLPVVFIVLLILIIASIMFLRGDSGEENEEEIFEKNKNNLSEKDISKPVQQGRAAVVLEKKARVVVPATRL
jgi:hypothetical protein